MTADSRNAWHVCGTARTILGSAVMSRENRLGSLRCSEP